MVCQPLNLSCLWTVVRHWLYSRRLDDLSRCPLPGQTFTPRHPIHRIAELQHFCRADWYTVTIAEPSLDDVDQHAGDPVLKAHEMSKIRGSDVVEYIVGVLVIGSV